MRLQADRSRVRRSWFAKRLLAVFLCTAASVAISGLLPALTPQALASDITLRMRGGTFEVQGQLKSFDLKSWVIATPGLGTLTLDAARYECISQQCPTRAVSADIAPVLPARAVTTTWIGGSAIGSEFLPRLIRAFAVSLGAKTSMQVGSDPKNLEFTILATDGRIIGKVNVNRQGVPQGFVAMTQGAADVVWTSRAIASEEKQMMATAGVADMSEPANQHVWALDALVVVVAKTNPVVSLTLDQIAKVFAGKITDWSELGLPPGKINVYAPTSEMGTWSYFENSVMAPRGYSISKDATRLAYATEWTDKVAADPLGIGINTISFVRRAKPVNIELTCGIVMPPSIFSAKNEEYPLTRRMYFYTRGRPENPLAAALLDFALSPRVQPVLKEANFVDQEPELSPFSAHTGRIAVALNASDEDYDQALMTRLIEDIRRAKRLSLTYRFSTAGITLDSRGNEDISRLGELLATPELAGKTVMLLGFSDAVGNFKGNLALAKRRAQIVRAALVKAAGKDLPNTVKVIDGAYGELAPVACNDNPEGRTLNRRVEVWVR